MELGKTAAPRLHENKYQTQIKVFHFLKTFWQRCIKINNISISLILSEHIKLNRVTRKSIKRNRSFFDSLSKALLVSFQETEKTKDFNYWVKLYPPKRICSSPNPHTCECNLTWKQGLSDVIIKPR